MMHDCAILTWRRQAIFVSILMCCVAEVNAIGAGTPGNIRDRSRKDRELWHTEHQVTVHIMSKGSKKRGSAKAGKKSKCGKGKSNGGCDDSLVAGYPLYPDNPAPTAYNWPTSGSVEAPYGEYGDGEYGDGSSNEPVFAPVEKPAPAPSGRPLTPDVPPAGPVYVTVPGSAPTNDPVNSPMPVDSSTPGHPSASQPPPAPGDSPGSPPSDGLSPPTQGNPGAVQPPSTFGGSPALSPSGGNPTVGNPDASQPAPTPGGLPPSDSQLAPTAGNPDAGQPVPTPGGPMDPSPSDSQPAQTPGSPDAGQPTPTPGGPTDLSPSDSQPAKTPGSPDACQPAPTPGASPDLPPSDSQPAPTPGNPPAQTPGDSPNPSPSDNQPAATPVASPTLGTPSNGTETIYTTETVGKDGLLSTCKAKPPESDVSVARTLTFEYAMLVAPGTATTDVDAVVNAVEMPLHNTLGMGILDCNFPFNRRRLEYDDFQFVSVLSLPKDRRDDTDCFPGELSEGTDCYPVIAGFTLYFLSFGSFEDLIAGLTRLISEFMLSIDAETLNDIDPNLKGLVFRGFIDDHNDTAGVDPLNGGGVQQPDGGSSNSNNNSAAASAVIGTAAAVMVIVGFFVLQRRRTRNRAYLERVDDETTQSEGRDEANSIPSSSNRKLVVQNHAVNDSFDEMSVFPEATEKGGRRDPEMVDRKDLVDDSLQDASVYTEKAPAGSGQENPSAMCMTTEQTFDSDGMILGIQRDLGPERRNVSFDHSSSSWDATPNTIDL